MAVKRKLIGNVKGPVGTTPNISIGTVTDLPAGSNPTATMSGTPEAPVLNLGLVHGESGNETIDDNAGIGDIDYVWSADKTQREINRADSKIDKKAEAIYQEKESAPLVSFADGADDMPVKDLKVAIEPVQDLHGYDHPWPAGGGKNLFKTPYSDTSKTIGGITVTVNDDGSVTFAGTATSDFYWNFRSSADKLVLPTGTYMASINGVPDHCAVYLTGGMYLNKSNLTRQITVSDDSGLTFYILIPPDAGAVNFTLKLQIEAGTTATAWSPYSNICPITGWTGAKIEQRGKNLYDMGRNTLTINGVTYTRNEDGSYTATGTATSASVLKGQNKNIRAGTYVMSALTNGNNNINATLYVDDKFKATLWTVPKVFTLEKDAAIRIDLYVANGQTADVTFYPQIELGSTATAYESSQGETYDITFPAAAGTVYGGTLDVTSGVLTVDRKTVVIDGNVTGWETGCGNANFVPLTRFTSDQIKQAATGPERSALCLTNRFKPITSSWSESLARDNEVCFGVSIDNYFVFNTGVQISDVPAWLNENPINFVYKLATPITYQLTPQEVRTLLGQNNIWADTGDINLLTYPTDTATRVDNVDTRITSVLSAMVAPVLSDMIADTALAVNQFRIVNDTLYKVTSPIASGGILTPGTNVIATSIGEQFTALLNA